jgi:hypothetical protein
LESECIDSVNVFWLQMTLLMKDLILKYYYYEFDYIRKICIDVCERCILKCEYYQSCQYHYFWSKIYLIKIVWEFVGRFFSMLSTSVTVKNNCIVFVYLFYCIVVFIIWYSMSCLKAD